MKTVTIRVMERKMNLVERICRMKDAKLTKMVLIARADRSRNRRKPARRWIDDIKRIEWRKRVDGKESSITEKGLFGKEMMSASQSKGCGE